MGIQGHPIVRPPAIVPKGAPIFYRRLSIDCGTRRRIARENEVYSHGNAMLYYPSSFLNLKDYTAVELNRRERDRSRQEIIQFDRYAQTAPDEWEGLFQIHSGDKSFRLTTFCSKAMKAPRKASFLRRLFGTSDWADHLPRRHLVALLTLRRNANHGAVLVGSKDVQSQILPPALLGVANRVPGLYIEARENLLAIEWPRDTGLVGANSQADDFCRLCFAIMANCPELIG